jgi:flagellar basal body-associated protein FliL
MQSESVLILVFIFIILIAVVVIGILYSMHVSKYDESHTFYKNLLEIIKTNPNLSLDLQDKLLEKDFDISDLSTSQIELSNIFGAKIYSDDQIYSVNTTNTSYTEGRITTFTSNMLKENERKYYQKAYNLIHDNNNLNLSNLYGIDFNNTGEVYNVLSNLHAVYDIRDIDNGMSYSNMNVKMNILQGYAKYYKYDNNIITLNSNLDTSNSITINNTLNICN